MAENIVRNNSPIPVTKFNQMKWAFIKVNFKVSQLQTWQKPQAKYNTTFERKRGFSPGPTIKHCTDYVKIISGRSLKNASSFPSYLNFFPC